MRLEVESDIKIRAPQDANKQAQFEGEQQRSTIEDLVHNRRDTAAAQAQRVEYGAR